MIGCDCAVCRSPNPRNHRYRCAVLVQTPEGNLLIDTPPELRLQLLREQIGVVHAVLYTHYHADHLFGLDDLRPIPAQARRPRAALLHRRGRGQDPHDVRLRLRPVRVGNGRRLPAEADLPPHHRRAVQRVGRARHAGAAGPRAVRRVRLPHRRRGLLHRRQRHPARELAEAGGAARAGAGRAAAAAAHGPLQPRPGPRRDRKAAAGTGLPDAHQSRIGI